MAMTTPAIVAGIHIHIIANTLPPLKLHSFTHMITNIDWFGCAPNASWEKQIHQILQTLSEIKPISRARLRVEEEGKSTDPFHLTLMLSMPGPDVLAHGRGNSFQSALDQINSQAHKKLSEIAQNP